MIDKNVSVPDWAVSDEEAENLIPKSGFIRDYMMQLQKSGDAPLIFHYATAVTILSCAVSKADIFCRNPASKKDSYQIPTPIWSALLGISGAARKSSCMNKGVRLLTRACAANTEESEQEVVLPSDGSLEGWHDFMCEHNEVLLHRDELSVLFDQSRRGYSEGLKNWLMEIHSGHLKKRATRKDMAAKEEKVIERPRLTILGGIPPAVFAKVAGAGDWNSGFLARFAFWPGERQWFNRYPNNTSGTETAMARWLFKYACRVKGYIYVEHEERESLMDWFEDNIEGARKSLPEGLYSHFVRYQDLGLRLAAMHAVSRRTGVHDHVEVVKDDMDAAIDALTVLRRATACLFQNTGRDTEREAEDSVLETLKKIAEPVTVGDFAKEISMSRATARRRLKELHEIGIIRCKTGSSKTVGRRPLLYFV